MQRIEGPLDFAHVHSWLAQSEDWLAGGRPLSLDLGGVTRCDSAGLALLLELSRRCRDSGAQLQLSNAPQQLRKLLSFYRLDDLLTLA